MDEEKAIYLSNAAACLPSTGNISQLRSHFLWVSATTCGNSVINRSVMCPKCCQVWNDGKFTLKLQSTANPGPRMVKILKKEITTPGKLNRVEKSLLQKYNKNIRNKIVLLCLACKVETVFETKKTEGSQLPKHVQTPVIEPVTPTPFKKKKKKDRFAGLNVSAVLSATPTPKAKPLSGKNVLNSENLAVRSVDRQLTTSSPTVPNTIYCTPRPQLDQIRVKTGSATGKQKMNLLRAEVKLAEQKKSNDRKQAWTTKNQNAKRSNKMQNFLRKVQKDIKLEDRINSLLQT